MKRFFMTLLISIIAFCGCSSTKFVMTGKKYPPLSEKEEVKLVIWDNPGNYEPIGIADLAALSLDKRIEMAKQIARANGGDVVMPKGLFEHNRVKMKSDEGYVLQTFLILRTKKEEAPDKSMQPDEKKDEVAAPDYKKLPRANYRVLVEDVDSVKGNKYQGSLYPVQLYRIPAELKSLAGEDKKIVMLSTASGKNKLLLLVPRERTKRFEEMIKSRAKLRFAYTPIAVYKSRYPVIDFIDEIK